jgi:protein SCO1/2
MLLSDWRKRRPCLGLAFSLMLSGLVGCEPNTQTAANQSDAKASAVKASKGGFHHTDVTGSSLKPALNLPDQSGAVRQISDFRGKLVLVFFGFTHCPDVCPSTLQEAAEALSLLSAEQAQRVQVVFVTLDPERDQPEMLEAYVKAFHPSFAWLRGSEEQTKAATKSFRVFYEKVTPKSGGPYTIDHTAASFVFDGEGQLRLYVKHAQGAKALAGDLARL